MKLQRLYFFTLSFLFLSIDSVAQTEGVAYTATGKGVATTFLTDYHSLGINSSALGWGTGYDKKRFTMGMTEFSLGIYSDQLSADKLGSLYTAIRNDLMGKEQESSTWDQQAEYASDYVESGISLDAHYNWFGFSFQSKRFGGIAFSIQEHYNWYSKLNETTSGLVFQGKFSDFFDELTVVYGNDTTVIQNDGDISEDTLNHVVMGTISTPISLSEVTRGSEVRYAWNRYYNFGYGLKLFGDSTFALFAGIGGRFIQSTAMFNMSSTENGLILHSSLSPNIGIDYGGIANSNSSTYTKTGGIPTSVGNGYGIDLSVSARLFNKIKVGLAVNNIGSVTYSRNVYRVKDTLVGSMKLDGLSNNNVLNSLDQFLEEGGILTLEGEEKVVVKNPATIRLGGSIELGKRITVGIDMVAPFSNDNPGGIENVVYSFGGEIRPFKWLQLSTGYYGGGIYAHNIPVGVNFVLGNGTYEFGIASRDALSFFMDKSNSVSTAFGVARFRF